jgi:hypothetical protein
MVRRNSEIDQLQQRPARLVAAHQYILRFDVPVDQLGRVRRRQRGHNLAAELDHFRYRKRPGLHEIIQVAPADVFHHQDQVPIFGLGHVLDFDHMRARSQAADGLPFADEFVDELGVRCIVLMQALD